MIKIEEIHNGKIFQGLTLFDQDNPYDGFTIKIEEVPDLIERLKNIIKNF